MAVKTINPVNMSLQVSERLRLLDAIRKALSLEEWYVIDTTLKAFGLDTSDTWNGERGAYVLEMASAASDTVLVDLAKYIGFELPPRIGEAFGEQLIGKPEFWRPKMLKVFISHLAAERQFAGELRKELLKFGISSFVAHDDIEPTKEWQVEIERALGTCDALVALLHPGFHCSNWTDQEIGFVMGRRRPTYTVRLGETPYGFIGRVQAFNGLGKTPKRLAAELFDAYRKNALTNSILADACVSLFEESDSFQQAKERVALLEQLDVWNDGFSERLLLALQNNNQISGSFGVPGRVKSLVQAHAAS